MHLFWQIGKQILPHPHLLSLCSDIIDSCIINCRSQDREYGSRLFVTDRKPLPHIVLLPYGQENNYIGIDVEEQDLDSAIQRVTGIMHSFTMDNPKSPDGHEVFPDLGPSISDVSLLRAIVAEKRHHVLAYFCPEGE